MVKQVDEVHQLVYKPPTDKEIKEKKAILGFKFSNDVFLTEAWLIKINVQCEDTDLEPTPFGLCHRIRKNKRDVLDQFPE